MKNKLPTVSRILLLGLALFVLPSCREGQGRREEPGPPAAKPTPPPLRIDFRKADAPEQSMILVVTNTSATETLMLRRLLVRPAGGNGSASYVLERPIGPLKSLDVVRTSELENWILLTGTEVEVEVHEYEKTVSGKVP